MRLIDLTGKKCGRLTVIRRCPINTKQNKPQWECLCECGNTVIVSASSLRSGNTKSCGCYKRDIDRLVNTTHGESKTKLYHIWSSIKDRCYNVHAKSYKDYGERGITMCDEWLNSYESFRDWAIEHGYEDGLSIERVDVNSNYCPANCTWIPLSKQCDNKRTTIYITIGDETKPLKKWCDTYDVKYSTALYRYHKGYSINEIFKRKD